ncbi:unnamed protein product [Sphagnum troendelagicum]|uniref:Uncharacterized protein n=1 Tax=Sphagnum troendelagicum TaxID=128251 RepID=A0ABP0UN20_9BRYO
MIESRFDHAEDMVVRWHLGYSERASNRGFLSARKRRLPLIWKRWTRSYFNDDHHHTVDDAAAASEISSSSEEDAAGDEDEDVHPVARPREIVSTTVDLISSRERERKKERKLNVIVCLGVSNSRVFFLYISVFFL